MSEEWAGVEIGSFTKPYILTRNVTFSSHFTVLLHAYKNHLDDQSQLNTPLTYPSAEYLIDGGAFFEGALRHHFGTHLLHIQHKGVEGFLDVGLLLLVILVVFPVHVVFVVLRPATKSLFYTRWVWKRDL